jgi:hypothetical protein
VDWVEDIAGDEVRRWEGGTGVCVASFEAGSPGVLKGDPVLEFTEDVFTPGDSDLGDVIVT